MRTFLFILSLSYLNSLTGQIPEKAEAIVAEGKKLYRSEMASWYGTDVFLEKFKDQRDNIGGYFSYNEKDKTHCLFFAKGATPTVLATITFDSTYDVNKASVDDQHRIFTTYENDLYLIRKKALEEINKDTLFKTYQNTNLNLVPLIQGNEKKVYVLTGPQVNGVVIFGNDYLLTFDDQNNPIAKKALHKNILPVRYGNEKEEAFGAMHTHLPETGDFITATDICTLMLYEKEAKWNQYIVISTNYVSIWNCKNNTLLALTRDAWDKINEQQKTKHR